MIELPEEFSLICTFITGSHLYGTNTELSDRDERGVFIPSKEYFLGFLKHTKIYEYKNKKDDIVYYEFRNFLNLACQNNPNILEFLFVPENKLLSSSYTWTKIVENRDLFLSKKAKYTFLGYSNSQFNRIKNHRNWLLNPPKKKPERSDFGLLQNRSLISKDQIGAFNELLSLYMEETYSKHPLKQQIEESDEIKDFRSIVQNLKTMNENTITAIKTLIPVDDNFIEALIREKAYMQASREWMQYQSWKENRNPARAKLEEKYGYDTKHASHLVRLLNEGSELLLEKKITFPRPEAFMLLDIINGAFPYELLLEIVDGFEKTFESLYEESTLPHSPDVNKINELCIKLIENRIKIKS